LEPHAASAEALRAQLHHQGFRTFQAETLAEGVKLARTATQFGTPPDVIFTAENLVDGPAHQLPALLGESASPCVLVGGVHTAANPPNGFAATLLAPTRYSAVARCVQELFGDEALAVPYDRPLAEAQLDLGAYRVLLADDHEINRRFVQIVLTKLNCRPDLAENGQEAIEAARRNAYDIILMDVQMPGVDGLAATGAIRRVEAEHPERKASVIIALTAGALAGEEKRCRESGMNFYLSKPLRPQALRSLLRQITESQPASAVATSLSPVPANGKPRLAIPLLDEIGTEGACEMFTLFLQEIDGRLEKLSQEHRGADCAAIARSAHSLVGFYGMVGADDAVELSRRLEAAALNGDLATAGMHIRQLRAGLKPLRSRVSAQIAEMRACVGASSPATTQ
jgi:CheY-like chemotaxis protein